MTTTSEINAGRAELGRRGAIRGFRKEVGMSRDQFWHEEGLLTRIAPHLSTDTRGKPQVDDLRVITGIVHVLKAGGRWIDAPADYGPRETQYIPERAGCYAGAITPLGASNA